MSPPNASEAPFLIVGLGNPGPRYASTRHNAGFMVVDELAHRHGLRFSTKQGNAEVAKGDIKGQRVVIAKPQTFMNNSGQSVRALASFYKAPNERVLIIYDEIALPVGTIRLREKGSSAGHNGVKSVIQHMGTEGIPRIRVGVDRPNDPRHKQVDWVLGRFTKDEHPAIFDAIRRSAEAVEAILSGGMERAMNVYNTTPVAGGTSDDRRPPSGDSSSQRPSLASIEKAADRRENPTMEALKERMSRIMHHEDDKG